LYCLCCQGKKEVLSSFTLGYLVDRFFFFTKSGTERDFSRRKKRPEMILSSSFSSNNL